MKKRERLSELARELGKERWRGVSKEERAETASKLARLRWKKATEEDRQAARQRLAEARKKRWPKKRSKDDGKKKPRS
jgi:hypothetical protein